MPSRSMLLSAFSLCLAACHPEPAASGPAGAASVLLTRPTSTVSPSGEQAEVTSPETHATWLAAYLRAPTKTWMQRKIKDFIAVYNDRRSRAELDHMWWNTDPAWDGFEDWGRAEQVDAIAELIGVLGHMPEWAPELIPRALESGHVFRGHAVDVLRETMVTGGSALHGEVFQRGWFVDKSRDVAFVKRILAVDAARGMCPASLTEQRESLLAQLGEKSMPCLDDAQDHADYTNNTTHELIAATRANPKGGAAAELHTRFQRFPLATIGDKEWSELFALEAAFPKGSALDQKLFAQMWLSYNTVPSFVAWLSAHPDKVLDDDLSFAKLTLEQAKATAALAQIVRRINARTTVEIETDEQLDAFMSQTTPSDPASSSGPSPWQSAMLRLMNAWVPSADPIQRAAAQKKAAKYRKPILAAVSRCSTVARELSAPQEDINRYSAHIREMDAMNRCFPVFEIAVGAFPGERESLTRTALGQPSKEFRAAVAQAFGSVRAALPAALRAAVFGDRESRALHGLILELHEATIARVHGGSPTANTSGACPDEHMSIGVDRYALQMFGVLPDTVTAASQGSCDTNTYTAHIRGRDGLPGLNVAFEMANGASASIKIVGE